MKGALKQIAFCGLGYASISMEVTVPLSVLGVVKMGIGIGMDFSMQRCVFFFVREYGSQYGSRVRFVLRPPKLHVLPVHLDRTIVNITEIENTSVLLIPTASPHVIQHTATQINMLVIVTPVHGFV